MSFQGAEFEVLNQEAHAVNRFRLDNQPTLFSKLIF
ncbi:MAG: hypothetical protein ACI8ZM_003581 [Crocinitomix sp.]|jgi:hypothetical protein